MPSFTYQARDKTGKQIKGVVEARDEKSAVILIKQRELFVTKIVEAKKRVSFSLNTLLKRVAFNEVVNFTRQLSTMVTAGLQLPQALTILRSQSNNQVFSSVLGSIIRDIEGGGSLGDALAKHPKLFSGIYISLIKAGESSGNLEKVLERLAENLEKDKEFRGKVKGALIYPAIIFIGMIVVVFVMMVFVVPQISQLYEDFGFDLPLTTRILINTSNFVANFWYLIIITVIVAIIGINRFINTSVGKKIVDSLILKLPIFGKLTKEILLVEFTRTLGMLVGAGIHLLDALQILTDSMGNVVYQDELANVAKRVEKGMPLGVTFAQSTVFPSILAQMVKVGEETGKLDDALIKLSVYFESESSQTVKGLTLAIEPVIMVILGIGVGFIVISIITPIYNLTSQIQ